MDSGGFGYNEIVSRIMKLDEELASRVRSSYKLPAVVVGGAALILTNSAPPSRRTHDIDFLEIPHEALIAMRDLDMNNAVGTFAFSMPSGWRDRAETINLDTEALDVSTPSKADLVIMKLIAGRETDRADIDAMIAMDPSLVHQVESILADPLEMEVNLEEREWNELRKRWESHAGEPLRSRAYGLPRSYGHKAHGARRGETERSEDACQRRGPRR